MRYGLRAFFLFFFFLVYMFSCSKYHLFKSLPVLPLNCFLPFSKLSWANLCESVFRFPVPLICMSVPLLIYILDYFVYMYKKKNPVRNYIELHVNLEGLTSLLCWIFQPIYSDLLWFFWSLLHSFQAVNPVYVKWL